jgi:hypothetical protein
MYTTHHFSFCILILHRNLLYLLPHILQLHVKFLYLLKALTSLCKPHSIAASDCSPCMQKWIGILFGPTSEDLDTQWCSLSRSSTASQKVTDLIPKVSLELFIAINLLATLWPWGHLSLQKKWVPEIFPGGWSSWCIELATLPPSCANCLEIWELQSPRTLRACPEIALPFFFIYFFIYTSEDHIHDMAPCSVCLRQILKLL